MAIIRLQSDIELRQGVYYQFDSTEPPIGEGGMGRVFKGICVDTRTQATRPVAIKFMFDDLPPSAYERARREAEIQLRNDNLVEMLGFIETEEQTAIGDVRKHYHVVSELLTGVSLSDVLDGKTKDRDGEDVPFAVKMLQDYRNDPEHFAKIIVMNVLSGLMALHDAGYIHRDIDPSNIMLTTEGHIKLIDFGIAKQMRLLTTGDKALTVAGKFMGKPEYAAPELVLGDISHQNQTTDIYAVGILLYQCIIGHTPFEGARHEVLEWQLHTKMDLKAIKNKALRNIIDTACQKKQELRYQTSAQMRVALENIDGARRPMQKKVKYGIIGGILSILVVLMMIFFIVKHKQDVAKHQAEEAWIQQEQAELDAQINGLIEKGLNAKKRSKDWNKDSFVYDLMDAYLFFAEAAIYAQKDTTKLPVIQKEMEDIEQQFQSAMDIFRGKATNALKYEDLEGDSIYSNLADSIQIFIKTHQI